MCMIVYLACGIVVLLCFELRNHPDAYNVHAQEI